MEEVVITARDPKGGYHAMTDVIHKVLNDITVVGLPNGGTGAPNGPRMQALVDSRRLLGGYLGNRPTP